ncbi:hypothetical protein U1701_16430 [Sphingomonas sp. PB2P19]|uniref:hypothetical protein n=1 Tax=Sphingomonas rhamnosi TaxID=3096156 RepID=UPI002FC7AAA9
MIALAVYSWVERPMTAALTRWSSSRTPKSPFERYDGRQFLQPFAEVTSEGNGAGKRHAGQ